jgi:hypothetical protein
MKIEKRKPPVSSLNDDSLLPIPKTIKTTESSCFLDKTTKNLPKIKDENSSYSHFINDRKVPIPQIISLTLDIKRRQTAASF